MWGTKECEMILAVTQAARWVFCFSLRRSLQVTVLMIHSVFTGFYLTALFSQHCGRGESCSAILQTSSTLYNHRVCWQNWKDLRRIRVHLNRKVKVPKWNSEWCWKKKRNCSYLLEMKGLVHPVPGSVKTSRSVFLLSSVYADELLLWLAGRLEMVELVGQFYTSIHNQIW